MPMNLSTFVSGHAGYSRSTDYSISIDEAGCQQLRQLMAACRTKNHKKARAWNFGKYDGLENTKTNCQNSTALALEAFYDIEEETQAIEAMLEGGRQLGMSAFLATTCSRDYRKTLTLIIPQETPLILADFARLTYVLIDRLKAHGVKLRFDSTSGAITHLFHVGPESDVIFIPGPICDGKKLIRQSKREAQNLDLNRFNSVGAQAAQAQLNPPTFTQVNDLFEGL